MFFYKVFQFHVRFEFYFSLRNTLSLGVRTFVGNYTDISVDIGPFTFSVEFSRCSDC